MIEDLSLHHLLIDNIFSKNYFFLDAE